MAETDDADEIRRQMEQIRCDLSQSVETLVESAREMTDWRYYVRQYPWAGVAAAAVVGYVIVPQRMPAYTSDTAAMERLMKRHRLMVAEPVKKGGLAGAVFGMISSLAMRGLMAYVGQQASRMFNPQEGDGSTEPEPAHFGGLPPNKPR